MHTDPSPIRRWSTDAVPPGQRLAYWVDAICDGFLEMAATSPVARDFGSTLESAALGAVGVHRVCGSAQDVYRTRRAIARSRENFYYLLCKTDGAWCAAQDGRHVRLLSGDLVLVDSRRCYEFHFPEKADTVSLELPTDWVASWLAAPQQHVGRRIDGGSGWGLALSALARQFTPELAAAAPLPARLLGDQLGALLALATGDTPPASATRTDGALRQRIADALADRHAEPGLCAVDIARMLGVSERTLHRHLAAAGTTFAQELLACRIDRARCMLLQPRFDALTIAEIGRRAGWSDASHFVRQCRRVLGATPAALRRQR
ncbi:helix-turn-helix domain-containing protein [Pseudorhodoferax sp.]|uniref:helix-turn-helix domain-containing protein n=1 Tax=Pseudorhodoferax sp. TaxID=1993553 RepID=UPI002DD69747|nr:helix-turn-helix domain-containing protein [Pseudorhodoferax sp.]